MTMNKSSDKSGADAELLLALRRKILLLLGRPPHLEEVRVRHVFSNAYRVNVFVMTGDQKLISESFFIRVNEAKKEIESSSPPIYRKY